MKKKAVLDIMAQVIELVDNTPMTKKDRLLVDEAIGISLKCVKDHHADDDSKVD